MLKRVESEINLLGSRDKRALLAIALVLGVSLIFVIFIIPAKKIYETKKTEYHNELELKRWLAQHRGQLVRAAELVEQDSKATSKDQLLGLISQSAEIAEIDLSRLEPSDDSVVVVIDKTKFSAMIIWLQTLSNEYGINVSELTATRRDIDTASVRMRLE